MNKNWFCKRTPTTQSILQEAGLSVTRDVQGGASCNIWRKCEFMVDISKNYHEGKGAGKKTTQKFGGNIL